MRAARPPIDGAWLEDELAELERLVAEGDTLGVITKLRQMVAEPEAHGDAVLEDTLALSGRWAGSCTRRDAVGPEPHSCSPGAG